MQTPDRYCLCTEASDETIKYTLNMIFSFLKTNAWFEGEIVVIETDEIPLSNENKKNIRELYPKVIFKKANAKTVSRYVELFNKKSKYPRELLMRHMVIEAFRLSSYQKVLYSSSTNVFFGNVSEFLSGEYDIKATYNSREFPYLSKVKNLSEESQLNTSLMVITEHLLNELVYQSLVDMVLSNKVAYDGLQKRSITEYVHRNKYEISFLSNSYLVDFSCFSDPLFRKYKRHEKQVKAIEFSIFDRNTPASRFKKVEQLWVQSYRKYLSIKPQPGAADPKEILRKDKPTLKTEEKTIETVNRPVGDKKKVMCTIATDNFMKGTLTMLYSFRSHNKDYNGDILILHSDLHVLSEHNMQKIRKIYENAKFRKVDLSEYDKVFERFNRIFSGNRLERFLPSLLTFEVFGLVEDYQQVLYLDSDMIIRRNVLDIFKINKPIVVTPDAGKFALNQKYNRFNGGFLFLNDSLNGKKVKKDIIDFSVTAKNYQLADQSIMNDFFKGVNLFYLDSRYNCLKRCFPDSKFARFDKRIKIIHYVGAKPWNSVKDRREKQYNRIEHIWKTYYDKMKKEINFSVTRVSKQSATKYAVFVHLYYQDLWNEVKKHLSKIPFEYDLYVTISKDHKNEISNNVLSFKKNAYILPIANRGADFGGFFTALNVAFNTNKKYDWILKIHGKKSLLISPKAGERWRRTSYQTLIPTDFSKLRTLFANKEVGMIGAKKQIMGLSTNDKKNGKVTNQEHIDFFRKKYKITDDELKFVGGSMFWMRYDLLKDVFFDERLTVSDFDPGHKPDGTKAHGMERFIANLVRDKKHKLIGI